jgi:antitoxin CptB
MGDTTDIEVRRRKARFRAQRRGFREVDLVFSAFAEAHLETLNVNELAQFEALLQVTDWQFYAWFMGHEPAPSEHDHAVFARLCAYRENLRAKT